MVNKNRKPIIPIIYWSIVLVFIVYLLLTIQFEAGLFNKFVLNRNFNVDFQGFNTIDKNWLMSKPVSNFFNGFSSKNMFGIFIFMIYAFVAIQWFIFLFSKKRKVFWSNLNAIVLMGGIFFVYSFARAGMSKGEPLYTFVYAPIIIFLILGFVWNPVIEIIIWIVGIVDLLGWTAGGLISWAAFGWFFLAMFCLAITCISVIALVVKKDEWGWSDYKNVSKKQALKNYSKYSFKRMKSKNKRVDYKHPISTNSYIPYSTTDHVRRNAKKGKTLQESYKMPKRFYNGTRDEQKEISTNEAIDIFMDYNESYKKNNSVNESYLDERTKRIAELEKELAELKANENNS